jgi:neutral ceramidase
MRGEPASRGRTKTRIQARLLGLLRIGDITTGAVNTEVFNPIAQRLKKESPYARTMRATLTNGIERSGYIPNDATCGMDKFEVLSSRLKPECTEGAIVNGILDLMAESRGRQ